MTHPEGPEKKYGPKIASLLRQFAKEVHGESKAGGVRITCEFVYWADKGGRDGGELRVNTYVTPDATAERLDGQLKRRGNQLQLEVDNTLQAQINRLKRGK